MNSKLFGDDRSAEDNIFYKDRDINGLSHVMRRPDSANIKATGGWSSTRKEPKGRLKPRWLDGMK